MRVVVAALLLAAGVLAGCASTADRPPVIHWQEDVCTFCRMVIEDRRYAAGYRLDTGEQRIFDDIGDLVLFLGAEKGQVASIWVQDLDREQWLPAGDAFFVTSRGIESPMGYGLAAVAGESRARELAAQVGGEVLTWQQLRAQGVKPPRS